MRFANRGNRAWSKRWFYSHGNVMHGSEVHWANEQ